MRGHSLVEHSEHDNSAADTVSIMVRGMYILYWMYFKIGTHLDLMSNS